MSEAHDLLSTLGPIPDNLSKEEFVDELLFQLCRTKTPSVDKMSKMACVYASIASFLRQCALRKILADITTELSAAVSDDSRAQE